MRAIIVEDQADVRMTFRKLVLRLGYEVEQEDLLANGHQLLLQLAKEPPPDLVVLDVVLPGCTDGIGLLFALREVDLGADPAVVLVSGIYSPDSEAARLIGQHAGVFLHKPFALADFSRAVEEASIRAGGWRGGRSPANPSPETARFPA